MLKSCLLLCFDCSRMFVNQVGCKYSESYLSWLRRVLFCSMASVLSHGLERFWGCGCRNITDSWNNPFSENEFTLTSLSSFL